MSNVQILEERKKQVFYTGKDTFDITCQKNSTAGSVSQRACVFCGSRVVLYPVADAVHLVHGPIGCASYTWDIRGSLSSGPELHRLSFSTDINEINTIFGGEEKLYKSLCELIEKYSPKAAFVYSTCIIGIIGDDVTTVCRRVAGEKNIPVIPVHSEGFKGTKKDGYKAACVALFSLVGTGTTEGISPISINILGEFNIAGEAWIIKEYYKKMGVEVVSVMTGDSRINDIQKSHGAALNVVQCSGSMTSLAVMMEEKYGIPFIRVSYFGLEDMSEALYNVARFFKKEMIIKKARNIVQKEVGNILPDITKYRKKLSGKKAALYVGGAFKAFSLVKALHLLGMEVVIAGSQTGNKDDYDLLKSMLKPGAVIVDDSNPQELSRFALEKEVDLFVGGVKERPMAMKLGIGFCDHNHERKIPLAGFIGMLNFAHEVYTTVMSPVWRFSPRNNKERKI